MLVREFDGVRYEYRAHLDACATSDDRGIYIGESQFATSTLKEAHHEEKVPTAAVN